MDIKFRLVIFLMLASVLLGIFLLIFLKKHRASFRHAWLYYLMRALVYGVLLTPTLFGLGHGVIPTNGLFGIIGVVYGPGENYKFSLSLLGFGRSDGGAVTLMPCAIVFSVNFALNLFKSKYAGDV